MPYSNYVYTDDNGNNWQITVPVDFATALGMVPATTEPYLDATISPRYANAYTSSGFSRSAIIKDLSQFSSIIGTTVVVDTVTYTFRGAFAQSIPPVQSALILSPQGPMGPAGPAGASLPLHYQAGTLPADVTLTSALTDFTLASLTIPAGTFLISASMFFVPASFVGQRFSLELIDQAGGIIAFAETQNTSADGYTLAVVGVYTSPAGETITVSAITEAANDVVKASGGFHGGVGGTNWTVLQVA